MRRLIIFIILILCWVMFIYADVGVQGSPILRMMYSAKEKAMSEATTADIPEISSSAYNPAGLVYLEKQQVGINYLRLLGDINYGTVAYGRSMFKGYITGNFNYWGMDPFVQYNANGDDLGNSLKYSGLGFIAGFGRTIKQNLSVGLKLKFYNEKLMEKSSSLLGVDVGGMYKINLRLFGEKHSKDLTVGLIVQNIGSYLNNFGKSESLPLCLKVGASYNAYKVKNNNVFVNIDIQEYFSEKPNFNFGVEWEMMNMIFIRGGYLLGLDKNLNTYSAGLGIKYPVMKNLITKLDYGIVPTEDLGYTHFVTLGLLF